MENNDSDLIVQVKKMLIKGLRLKVSVDDIDRDAPLFGEGLGLDSVDALEVVIAIEKEFGKRIPDAAVGSKVLASVNTIAEFVKNG